MEQNDTALSERRQWAATLYALGNLFESGEIGGGDGATVAMYDMDARVRSEVPALSVTLTTLADNVMETAYGPDGWSEGDDGHDERAELLYSILGTDVPAIMNTIRLASLENALR